MNNPHKDPSDGSDRSNQSGQSGQNRRRRLRPAGGYRNTASFQTATIIYDATYWFCEKFLDPRSRTFDQMVQAARSGRQNIAEGSRFAATSSQTELRLINAARSSLEELLLDFEDYLRHRHLPQWDPDSPEARAVREVPLRFRKKRQAAGANQPNSPDLTDLSDRERWDLYAPWFEHDDPVVRANAIICLIHQANYLLDQQISALERAFIEEGGYSEQLAAARLAHRTRCRNPQNQSDTPDPSDPTNAIPCCPKCGKPMTLRTARSGKHAGRQFWGCTAYPNCKGVLEL